MIQDVRNQARRTLKQDGGAEPRGTARARTRRIVADDNARRSGAKERANQCTQWRNKRSRSTQAYSLCFFVHGSGALRSLHRHETPDENLGTAASACPGRRVDRLTPEGKLGNKGFIHGLDSTSVRGHMARILHKVVTVL